MRSILAIPAARILRVSRIGRGIGTLTHYRGLRDDGMRGDRGRGSTYDPSAPWPTSSVPVCHEPIPGALRMGARRVREFAPGGRRWHTDLQRTGSVPVVCPAAKRATTSPTAGSLVPGSGTGRWAWTW